VWDRGATTHSLVEAGCVGVLVLLDDGHDEGDQLGPEVEVLDAGALLLWGDLPLLGLKERWVTTGMGTSAWPVPTTGQEVVGTGPCD
jgi:hypothetical protein